MRQTMRSIRPAIAATAALLLFAGCKKDQPDAQPAQPANAGVEATAVHPQQTTDYLDIPARVMADPSRVVHIYPPLSGRIFGLKVLPGQEVKKGQEIATLQSSDVASSRSDYEKAKIEVLRADRALQRGKLLLDHEVLSQADYYELQAVDQVAHSELERARQRIHELGFAEDGTSDQVALRSPIAGAVLDIGTAAGELQRSLDNATAVATIADLDSVWVSGDVYERDLESLKSGRPVQVLVPAYPDLHLSGKIANIGDAFDPNTHTLKLRVVLPNPNHLLKPDMFATVHISEATRTMFVVPETAVLHDGDRTFVFVEKTGGKYDQRNVQVGRNVAHGDVKSIEVLSGLNDGDQVVTTGGALLRPVTGD